MGVVPIRMSAEMEKADPAPAETFGFDDLPHKGEVGPVAFPLGKLTPGMKEAPTSPSMGIDLYTSSALW